MHIAYICADPGIPVFGTKGSSVHVQEVLAVLVRKGHKISLLCAKQGDSKPARLERVECIELPCLPKQSDPRFWQCVDDLQFALSKTVRSLDSLDIVYERYSLWSYAAMETAKDLGIPSCLEVNAYLIDEQSQYRELIHRGLAQTCFQRVCAATQTIYAVSHGVKNKLKKAGITDKKIGVIHNGVDPERFLSSKQPTRLGTMSKSSFGITVGFCGSLKPWHGVIDLIDAFSIHYRNHRGSRLKIIGDGPERKTLERRISDLHLQESILMLGAVPAEQVPTVLGNVDVAVAPYPSMEEMYFSPLKIFEYLSLEICTVASRTGDIPSLIEHNVTGILYEPGNIPELAGILDDLLKDPHRIQMIANAGRVLAESSYTWDQVVERFLALVFEETQSV